MVSWRRSVSNNDKTLQCKVKIGSAYEPKWFERRYTQGTYSAKNIPPCEETAWLQVAMLGVAKPYSSKVGRLMFVSAALVVAVLISYY
jgi:hypothetical protein